MSEPPTISAMFAEAKPGDESSIARLLPLVYAELKALASTFLDEQAGHTLQPTALVHEAYLKLVGGERKWNGRDHFVATAARAMRQILVDHARRKNAEKRGRGASRANLSIETMLADESSGGSTRDMRVLELDRLLTRLDTGDGRAARVAEMRLFGGMTQEQIAAVLGVSRATVASDWAFARAWLISQTSREDER